MNVNSNLDLQPNSIAVIGMSIRCPGAKSVEQFWQNLVSGKEMITFLTEEELEQSHVDPAIYRSINYVPAAAMLDGVEYFDAEFFGFSPQEATILDPQHRILLECAWEACENAGYSPHTTEQVISIYAGCRISEYLLFNQLLPDINGVSSSDTISSFQRLIANDKDYVTSRIAYKLNLKGGAVTVLTACSTGLVATHLACESLLRGECDMALAGGVSVRVPQNAGYLYSDGMIFSPDGHTRAFDINAGGTMFGSGAGIILLKRLSDAVRDQDNILATICGSAINNDGNMAKGAFTAPSVDGQAQVIEEALAVAGLKPEAISYIEAHGTATALGDLIEIEALKRVFGGTNLPVHSCAIGSVKTNVGHASHAAGIIGLIKTILMLKHKQLVPSINFEQPNPQLELHNTPFYVQMTLEKWNSPHGLRRAGVSSFGIGGTNAHIVLEEAPENIKVSDEYKVIERPVQILCLSAPNHEALQKLTDLYIQYLNENEHVSLADICFTANAGRTHFKYRLALIGTSHKEMVDKLNRFKSGNNAAGLWSQTRVVDAVPPPIAFLFTGQGSQYKDMGRQLYETQPSFHQSIDQCAQILEPYLDQPLISILYPIDNAVQLLDWTCYAQPALFALEYALAQLLLSWNIVPAFLTGHSLGEIVAACIAGVITLHDALFLVAARGRLMQQVSAPGKMAAVFASESQVVNAIQSFGSNVSIAAINGPTHIVVSGDADSVDDFLEYLNTSRISYQLLNVSHAFHSALMDSILEEFAHISSLVDFRAAKIPIVSCLTGSLIEQAELTSIQYWKQQIREPVQFFDAMTALYAKGCRLFVECGPTATLVTMAKRCIADENCIFIAPMKAGDDTWHQFLECIGHLYVHGINVNWEKFDGDYSRHRVELPTYPFQRKRYWIETIRSQPTYHLNIGMGDNNTPARSPLLGRKILSPLQEIQFQSQITSVRPSFLGQHKVFEQCTVPMTALLELIVTGVKEAFAWSIERLVLEDFTVLQGLQLQDNHTTTIQTVFEKRDSTTAVAKIFSLAEDKYKGEVWVLHAECKVSQGIAQKYQPNGALVEAQGRCIVPVPLDEFYQRKQALGIEHGHSYRNIQNLWIGATEALAHLRCSEDPRSLQAYLLFPPLLDSCFQIAELAVRSIDNVQDRLFLPFYCEKIIISNTFSSELWSHAHCQSANSVTTNLRIVDIDIYSATGSLCIEVHGVHFRGTNRTLLMQSREPQHKPQVPDELLYKLSWSERTSPPENVAPIQPGSVWLIFTDSNGNVNTLAKLLYQHQAQPYVVLLGAVHECTAEAAHVFDPTSPNHFVQFLTDVLPGRLDALHVVYMWGGKNDQQDDEKEQPSIVTTGAAGLLHLVQALNSAVKEKYPQLQLRLFIITQNAQVTDIDTTQISLPQSLIVGLARTIISEHPELECRLIDLDSHHINTASLLEALTVTSRNREVVIRNRLHYLPKLVRYNKAHPSLRSPRDASTYPPVWQLVLQKSGELESLAPISVERRPPGPGEIEISVRATGLNFRDVLNVIGALSGPLGAECSGVVVACGEGVTSVAVGDSVLAIAPSSLSAYVTVNIQHVVLKPKQMSFAEAATIPIVFMSAYYGLVHLAKLSPNDRILIHSAAGGVGHAAIQVAETIGAEIFATAHPQKWKYLEDLGVKHIFNSRTLEFAELIQNVTQDKGVTVVLNTLAGASIEKSLSILALDGRFVELGVTDVWDAQQVHKVRPDVEFFHFRLMKVAEDNPSFFQEMFQEVIKKFETFTYKPLPFRTFRPADTADALNIMIQAKHVGKLVIEHSDTFQSVHHPPFVKNDATYLITGGLAGLGLRAAQWLVAQGAKHLVLIGRKAPSLEAKKWIDEATHNRVNIEVAQLDVTDRMGLARVIDQIGTSPSQPLRGIIHAAGILSDSTLQQQTWGQFEEVLAPKVAGGWNLHTLTQHLELDFFVMYSSIASIFGNAGQSNYVAANAFLDALAHFRATLSLPSLVINWGAWAEIGMAERMNSRTKQHKEAVGIGYISPSEGIEALEYLMQQETTQASVMRIDWPRYLAHYPPGRSSLLFTEFASSSNHIEAPFLNVQNWGETKEINETNEMEKTHHSLVAFVSEELSRLLGIDQQQINPDSTLFQLGVDSLTAILFRNRIMSSKGFKLPLSTILQDPKVSFLATVLAEQAMPLERTNVPAQVERQTSDSFDDARNMGERTGSDKDVWEEGSL